MDDNPFRQRAKRKLLKVTFPNGKSICYKNVTTTMIDVLKEIGVERFPEITLEMCHLPLVSREAYPRYKEWMKPICDGWFLNSQSNTGTKFLQLKSISDSLGLDLVVEIGEDLEAESAPKGEKKSRTKDKLLVKMPDGEFIANENSADTFLEVIWQLGLSEIERREILYSGHPIISSYKSLNNQVQVDSNKWVVMPLTTKERAKVLKVIALLLRLKIEVTVI